jgi:hypothetical protein
VAEVVQTSDGRNTARTGALAEAPELEGWISLPAAAQELGYTKQAMHYIADSGKVTTLRKVLGRDGRVHVYLMRRAELPVIAQALESEGRHGRQADQDQEGRRDRERARRRARANA